LRSPVSPPTRSEKFLYQNNFEQAAVDKVPEEFLVLDGGFVVKEINGNKVLQLPGAPLETFGVLFGRANQRTRSSRRAFTAREKGEDFRHLPPG
jgi:hypothetical protein